MLILAKRSIVSIVIFFILFSCNLVKDDNDVQDEISDIKSDLISVYFCGGQSNANGSWFNGIKSEILKVDPEAIVLHNYHPSSRIALWHESGVKKELYYEDMALICNYVDPLKYDFKGFFWYQGESDRDYYKSYEQEFFNMINDFKYDLKDLSFNIFFTKVYGSYGNITFIRNVQQQIINNNDNIYGIDAYDYERKPDGVHLTPEASEMIGRDIVKNNLNLF